MANPELKPQKLQFRTPNVLVQIRTRIIRKNMLKLENLKLEDDFPCAQSPAIFFTDKGVEWGQLPDQYEIAMKAKGATVMGYSRWLQYVHFWR